VIRPYVLVAPNGARRGHRDHPALPVTVAEIAATAKACRAAGADGIHLHVRDDAGQHTLDAGRYREAISAIRHTAPGLDVQITTEAADFFDVATQFDCLKQVRPEWASISVREIARDADLADAVYGFCANEGINIQHILYGREDAALLQNWQAKGIVRATQAERLLVLGRHSGAAASTPADLDRFLQDAPPPARWMACAFGPDEHACLARAATLGGDVRVGFENSLTNASGSPWTDPAASVAALLKLLQGDLA
jgi:uncharacterized protein (DUF849 family)